MSYPKLPSLPEPAALEDEITHALPRFRQVRWVASTQSTNADLMHMARAEGGPLARPWLLGAHLQERGRGRAGRSWQNRAGANLMFSCAFDVFLPVAQLPTLSPLAGLAACEALRTLLGDACRDRLSMKWPNDIQWEEAKLAGILVETTRARASRLAADHYVAVIGMGINLDDARALSQSLNRRIADWSEIARADGHAGAATHAAIVARIAQSWYDSLNDATAFGFDALPRRYAAVDALAGRHIHVLDNGRLVQAGVACGVNTAGQLLLRTPEGEAPVHVGEVSVRPRQETA